LAQPSSDNSRSSASAASAERLRMTPRPAILPLALCAAGALALRSRVDDNSRADFPPPCKYFTREPTLCRQGNSLWSDDELLAALPAFAEMYRNRPLYKNVGGVDVNHAFALWFSVRQTKPKYIIESGANLGGSTYLLRQAAPEAMIFSLDPREEGWDMRGPGQLHFHDDNPKTVYFRAGRFKDFAEMDWDSLIPRDERDRAFVMLDDHMSSVRRSREMLEKGFLHLWYDDNWINGDTYSFNLLCSPREPADGDKVLMKDVFGRKTKSITLQEHSENVAWLQQHTEAYFEFPALYDGCTNHTRLRSLLTKDELRGHGLPTLEEDWQHYQHLYAPYVKLRM